MVSAWAKAVALEIERRGWCQGMALKGLVNIVVKVV